MNFNSLSDSDLLETIKVKTLKERELTLEILRLLREIEKRKMYLARGYPSLHAFCVEELKYSDAAAQRRIQSMRLLKEIPEAEEAILKGKLNLTTVSMVQGFFVSHAKERKSRKLENTYEQTENQNRENIKGGVRSYEGSKIEVLGITEKRELLFSMNGKSKREVEKALVTLNPNFLPQEKERVLTDDKTEIKFVADEKLLTKLRKLKALMSHKTAHFSYAELIEELADQALKRMDSTPPAESQKGKINTLAFKARVPLQNTRYIPAKIKKFIWQMDQGRCQFVDFQTHRQCGSTHFIQIDHIKPYSQNGSSNDPQNLRLFCGQHNRWRYNQELGAKGSIN